MAKKASYYLDNRQFSGILALGFRDYYDYSNGQKGPKAGVVFDTVMPDHGFDKLAIKIPGMVEPPEEIVKLADGDGDFEAPQAVKFESLQVTQYVANSDSRRPSLAMSATAEDVLLENLPASKTASAPVTTAAPAK